MGVGIAAGALVEVEVRVGVSTGGSAFDPGWKSLQAMETRIMRITRSKRDGRFIWF
jgi:hypothetical protein